jgi:hypothetical protein
VLLNVAARFVGQARHLRRTLARKGVSEDQSGGSRARQVRLVLPDASTFAHATEAVEPTHSAAGLVRPCST